MALKKYKEILVAIAFLTCVSVACNDVLEAEEQNAIDQYYVFNDASVAELALNQLYTYVLPSFYSVSTSSTDPANSTNVVLTDDGAGDRQGLLFGLHQEPVENGTESLGNYSVATFGRIREVNLLKEGIEFGSIQEDSKLKLLGQLRFIRAWLYWKMVRDYGGVPIVRGVLDVNDRLANHIPRSSTRECIDFIIEDLDYAIDNAGSFGDEDFGRITSAAAAAFKGRVLLFYASPMYVADGMTNADGQSDRWDDAYQANLVARQIAEESGHSLHPDFSKTMLDESNPVEAIFLRKYSTTVNPHGYESAARPRRANESNPSAASSPNWNFVQSFPMRDGHKIGESPTYAYDEQTYWENRDPRFYATVAYNSCEWTFQGENSGTRQWTYEGNSQQPITPSNGFFLRKNIDTSKTIEEAGWTDWVEIRFTEVLLNLAEAANESGHQDEAYSILHELRARAGVEAGTGGYGIADGLSKTELREIIMNERRIELAYEDKRYWDLRRRNLYANGIDGTAGAGLNGTTRKRIETRLRQDYLETLVPDGVTGSDVVEYFEAHIRDTVDWDQASNYGLYFETEVIVIDRNLDTGEDIPINYLQPKYNFFYLPTRATEYNNNVEQNIGWPNGTFDPLAD